jgi:methionyl-tRNA formyltransferase
MKIAFFGLPIAALLLHQDGHTIAHATICRKGAIGTRRLARLLGRDRVETAPGIVSTGLAERVEMRAPDLIVSWFWTTKLPSRVLKSAPLGAFGVHPSLLPQLRGPDPYFAAIDRGLASTGVTAHRLEDDYDTGAILGTRSIAIESTWSAWTLAKKLDRPSLALLRDVANAFARGEPPKEVAQDESQATHAPSPNDDELEIDWSWNADRILRRVRAACPWPGAFTFFGDTCVTITKARAHSNAMRALAIGEAVVHEGAALVKCEDGAIEVLEGRDEDDEELDRGALVRLLTHHETP